MNEYTKNTRLTQPTHRWSLLAIIVVTIGVGAPFFSDSYYPVHDTLSVFHFFSYYFSQLTLAHEVPMWLPSSAFGMPIEPYILFSLGPFQYLALAMGYLFDVHNTLTLFSISLVGDTLFLAFGTYLFCYHILQSRWISIACVISMLLLVEIDQGIYWNFKILLPLPFSLYFAQRGIESLNPAYLLASMATLLGCAFGSLPYVLPVQFYVVLCYSVCLVIQTLKWSDFRIRSFMSLRNQLIDNMKQPQTFLLSMIGLFVLIICGLMMYKIKSVMVGEMAYVDGGRNADMGVSLDTFLTYAGNTGYEKLIEMLNGFPTVTNFHHDFLAFAGLVNVIFVIYSLFSKQKSNSQIALTITTILAIAFTVTATGVAHIAYHLPGMNIVRHIGYLIVVGKILLIMLSGFGIRAYLHKS